MNKMRFIYITVANFLHKRSKVLENDFAPFWKSQNVFHTWLSFLKASLWHCGLSPHPATWPQGMGQGGHQRAQQPVCSWARDMQMAWHENPSQTGLATAWTGEIPSFRDCAHDIRRESSLGRWANDKCYLEKRVSGSFQAAKPVQHHVYWGREKKRIERHWWVPARAK